MLYKRSRTCFGWSYSMQLHGASNFIFVFGSRSSHVCWNSRPKSIPLASNVLRFFNNPNSEGKESIWVLKMSKCSNCVKYLIQVGMLVIILLLTEMDFKLGMEQITIGKICSRFLLKVKISIFCKRFRFCGIFVSLFLVKSNARRLG